MIVDDSRTSRKILRTLLEQEGNTIIAEAENGEIAIEKYKELKPDVVTMDITMPIMDGIGALGKIREYDKEAVVVMVTAAGQRTKMIEAIKLGAEEFVTKPFEENEIKEVFRRITNK